MTAARQSIISKRNKSQDKKNLSDLNNNNSSKSSDGELLKQKSGASISHINYKKLFRNLKVLRLFQQSSCVLAFSLVIATSIVYVSSFYLPQKWSKQYKQLTILQRQERELTRVNESLKKQLAQQAQSPDAGLESFDPTKAIFIEPAENSVNTATKDKSNSNTLFDRVPLGY
jgi:hypothetical protein